MWCRKCHREVAAVPTADGSVDCPFCGRDARVTEDRQPTTRIHRRDPPHLRTSGQTRSRQSLARSTAHDGSGGPTSERPAAADAAKMILETRSWANLTGFFVIVFLVGQLLTIWAFLAGSFPAWSMGQLFLSVGLAAALWLVVRRMTTLSELNQQLSVKLRQLNRRQHQRSKKSAGSATAGATNQSDARG